MDLLPLMALFSIMNSIKNIITHYLHPRSYLCTSEGVCKYSLVVGLLVLLWVGLVVATMKIQTEPVLFSKSRFYSIIRSL